MISAVAGGVPFKFSSPKFPSGLRQRGILAPLMSVPETAVHENNSLMFRQGNIWFSRQVLPLETETVTHPVQDRTNYSLWTCVGALDPAHVPASSLRR